LHYLCAQSDAFKGTEQEVRTKILAGYDKKINKIYPEMVEEIIYKLVK